MSIESLAHHAVPFQVDLGQRFRATQSRTGLVFVGPSGWGEFAPFDDYDDATAGRWLASALEAAFGTWPAPRRTHVPVNAIIPAVSADVASVMTQDAVTKYGMSTFKIKVGVGEGSSEVLDETTHVADLARVSAVRETLNRLNVTGLLRIDVNAGWSLARARELAARFDDAAQGLDYIEQPCATLTENAKLRSQTHVHIAIDEGLRLAHTIDLELFQAAADVLIVKAIPMGGVNQSLDLLTQLNIPVVVS